MEERYLIEKMGKLIARVAKKNEEYASADLYWLRVVCGNCGFKGSLGFMKGQPVGAHACPNCENKALS